MFRIPALLTAIVVVAASGVVHGLWTDRWVWSAERAASAAKLDSIPTVLGKGEWLARTTHLDPNEQANAGIVGALARIYVHQRTGREVQLVLVCGRPGHIAIHTPDVCYESSGYDPVGEIEKYTLDTGSVPAEFHSARFVKRSAVADQVRVFWSWSAAMGDSPEAGRWQVPENPRLTFARYKALFKLYVIRVAPKIDEPVEKDPSVEFIQALLPELQRFLYPG